MTAIKKDAIKKRALTDALFSLLFIVNGTTGNVILTPVSGRVGIGTFAFDARFDVNLSGVGKK